MDLREGKGLLVALTKAFAGLDPAMVCGPTRIYLYVYVWEICSNGIWTCMHAYVCACMGGEQALGDLDDCMGCT